MEYVIPVEVADDPPLALPPGLRQFPLQQRHQLCGGFRQRGQKQPSRIVKHHRLPDLAADELTEKQVLVPQPLLASAQLQRVLKCPPDAFDAGGDQKGVESQPLGGGVGHRIAQNGLVAGRLQPLQRGLYLLRRVDGENINIVIHQLAEHLGIASNVVVGDHGSPSHRRIRLIRQFQCAKKVVHGNLDLDHRQGELLTQHLGRAAPGDHHIVIPAKIALCDLHALFQVSYMQRQVHLRKFFGHPRHHRRDPLIGRDPQDMDVRLHSHSHLSEKSGAAWFHPAPTPSEIVSI